MDMTTSFLRTSKTQVGYWKRRHGSQADARTVSTEGGVSHGELGELTRTINLANKEIAMLQGQQGMASCSSRDGSTLFGRRANAGAAGLRKEGLVTDTDRSMKARRSGTFYRQSFDSKFLIHPNDEWMRYWDIVMAVMLVFTAIVTPYEVSFLDPHLNALYVVNRIIDLCFIFDIGIQFFLAYYNPETNSWVTGRWRIALRYMRGMLLLDTLSVLPFDTLGIVLNSQQLNKLKVIRLVRLLRLSKLIKIFNSGRIVQRLETMAIISYASSQLMRFLILVLMIAHWMACVWHMVRVAEDNPEMNWLLTYNMMGGNDEVHSAITKYIAALYWAAMTMSTIGYGDIVPQTHAERCVAVLCMMGGASVFAYLIGSVCGLIASLGREQSQFYEMMDELGAFMEESRLPTELSVRTREFFHYRRHNKTLEDRKHIFNQLSPALRAEWALHSHAKTIAQLQLFNGEVPEEMLVEMALALKSETYSPNEVIFKEGDECSKLYLIQKGVIVAGMRLMTSGTLLGADCFYVPDILWKYQAVTLTYCVIYSLKVASFNRILERYKAAKRLVQHASAKYMLRQSVVFYARAEAFISHSKSGSKYALLPRPQDIGGRYISHRQYEAVLRLLFQKHPELRDMVDKATSVLQAFTNGKSGTRFAPGGALDSAYTSTVSTGQRAPRARRRSNLFEVTQRVMAAVKSGMLSKDQPYTDRDDPASDSQGEIPSSPHHHTHHAHHQHHQHHPHHHHHHHHHHTRQHTRDSSDSDSEERDPDDHDIHATIVRRFPQHEDSGRSHAVTSLQSSRHEHETYTTDGTPLGPSHSSSLRVTSGNRVTMRLPSGNGTAVARPPSGNGTAVARLDSGNNSAVARPLSGGGGHAARRPSGPPAADNWIAEKLREDAEIQGRVDSLPGMTMQELPQPPLTSRARASRSNSMVQGPLGEEPDLLQELVSRTFPKEGHGSGPWPALHSDNNSKQASPSTSQPQIKLEPDRQPPRKRASDLSLSDAPSQSSRDVASEYRTDVGDLRDEIKHVSAEMNRLREAVIQGLAKMGERISLIGKDDLALFYS